MTSIALFVLMHNSIYLYAVIALLILAFVDYKTKKVAVSILLFSIIFISITKIIDGDFSLYHSLLAGLIVSLPYLIVTLINTKLLGGGDYKVMFFIGFTLGLSCGLTCLFVTIITSGVYALFCLLLNKKDNIPLVPFMFFSLIIIAFLKFDINDYFMFLV